jgi:antitoxin component HigA of HigAB toxin-antitoxin module
MVGKMTAAKLRSEDDLNEAIEKLDLLLVRTGSLTSEEQAALDCLTDQIREYEAQNIEMPRVSNVDVLKFLLESHNISTKELSSRTGVQDSAILDFLNGGGVLIPEDGIKIARQFNLRSDFFSSVEATAVHGE